MTQPRQQYGVAPYRVRKGRLEVLLVTSRETRRWILPKGWPMKGRAPHDAAATEAFEEAGVEGEVDPEPLGAYRYVKRTPLGDTLCEVQVFPLQVKREHETWLEQGQRERRWFVIAEAIETVGEPELKPLLEAFRATAGRRARR